MGRGRACCQALKLETLDGGTVYLGVYRASEEVMLVPSRFLVSAGVANRRLASYVWLEIGHFAASVGHE